MIVRFFCKTHNVPLANCGNGRILFPTACINPIIDKDGWMELDASEFYCPVSAKMEDCGATPDQIGECIFEPEVKEGFTISAKTVLTDEGWKYPVTWTLDDAMYGLRNLAVGDEEQVRIGDCIEDVQPEALREEVRTILSPSCDLVPAGERSKYDRAYETAIWPLLKDLEPLDVIASIRTWVDGWDPGYDETESERSDLRHDMYGVYKEMKGRM